MPTYESAARAGPTTLGVGLAANILGLDGSQTGIWNGQTVGANDVLVMYTYAGDANLDGQVDAGDFGVLDHFVGVAGSNGFANGDFNLDGFIDAGDYGVLDYGIGAQGEPLGTTGATGASVTGDANGAVVTSVPEPSATATLVAAAAALGLRARPRRRRRGS